MPSESIKEPIPVAVIGAGGMGQFLARVLAELPGVELQAVVDTQPELAASVAAELGLPVFTDPAVVAAAGYGGVIIASPDHTHAELTLAALGAGSRVLCEKPLSHDLAGAHAVIDAEVAAGRRSVQVGFMREYDPAHVALAEELSSLGAVQYVRCTHRNNNAVTRPPETVLVQSVIHDIHTVEWLTGASVTEVDAHAVPRDGGLDHVVLLLRLDSGIAASIEFSDRAYAYEVEVEVTAVGGMVSAGQPSRPIVRHAGAIRTPASNDWFGRFAEAYRIEDRAWVASLHDDQASGPSAWDSYTAQLVADAALRSLATGAPQSLDGRARPPLYSREDTHTKGHLVDWR